MNTQVWQALFEFQKDGVKGAINKILTHNGCILADSVGLGKTYEALAVIKYFELLNYRVLVLCPKKLSENWRIYKTDAGSTLNPFPEDKFGYTLLYHTDLSRQKGMSGSVDLENFNWGNYDLVVIDESHNFRNDTKGKKDEDGNLIRKSRYERLLQDVIQGSAKTRVLMLSATPVNNSLSDLRNQLRFITEDKDNAFLHSLGVLSMETVLRNAQNVFTRWAKRDSEEREKEVLLEALSSAFFKLLDGLTIARSRGHITRYYRDTLNEIGQFPKRRKPDAIYADIDLEEEFPPYDVLNKQISAYKLSLFNPSSYVYDQYMQQYELDQMEHFTQRQREGFLIGMMKVNFLKRLESSVHSFEETLKRTLDKIEGLQAKINTFKEMQEESQTFSADEMQDPEEEDEEILDAFTVGKKLEFKLKHIDLDRWLGDLQADYERLESIYELARQVDPARDAKLAELKNIIHKKVEHPSTNSKGEANRKVVVFTAYADTAFYLYDALKAWAQDELGIHIAVVSGGNKCRTTLGSSEFNNILTNFSPRAKLRDRLQGMSQDEEIDLLIATDCVSEGQNLQDCDLLVNYDIHWNPVRILQRFGRIDRIGSLNNFVHLVNFWPTKDLDQYISLKTRVEARMALVDITATGEDDLLDTENIQDLIEGDLKFRDRQLKRLREEILEMEDFNESISLNEFTLDDFRMELRRFLERSQQRLRDAPLGLFTVVPAYQPHAQINPGMIFCLAQKGESESTEVNPLQPYFLVYVLEDGNIRYSFANPKQILERMRECCAEKIHPYNALCDQFDTETKQGNDMHIVDDMLKKALQSIIKTFRRRAAASAGSGRTALFPKKEDQVSEDSEFDLVTWLVIKEQAEP